MSSGATLVSPRTSYGTLPSTSSPQNGIGSWDHVTPTNRHKAKRNEFVNPGYLSYQSDPDDIGRHVAFTGKDSLEELSKQDGDFDQVPLTTGDRLPLIAGGQDEKESPCERYTSCRWTLTYLGFLMIMLFFCMRSCISMALVCMEDLQNTPYTSGPVYITADMQGLVLSSYYYGYSVTPLLAGMMAEKFGGKRVLTVAVGASATFTLLTPAMIRLNVYLVVTFRILLGMATGFCIPCIMAMESIWAPSHEKARHVAIVFTGVNIGAILANFVSGFLCSIPVDEGWPFIFYTYGGVSLLWTILWWFVVHDTPEKHPRISTKELQMLSKPRTSLQTSSKTSRLPLKSFFTSGPCLAMTYSLTCDFWLLCLCSTYTPIYFNQLLRFDTEMSGTLSSLPYLAALLSAPTFAAISDRLHAKHVLSITRSRKLFQAIANLVPVAMFCGLGVVDHELRYLAVVMVTATVGFLQANISGVSLTRFDVAPRFTGSVTGLTTMVCNIAQIVSPLIISDIISDNRQESWSEVFFITAAIGLSGIVVFLLFGSAQEQEWAKDKVPEMTITPG